MKPLKKCVNGCNAPVKPPSAVLCAKCLTAVGEKMQEMCDPKHWQPRQSTLGGG